MLSSFSTTRANASGGGSRACLKIEGMTNFYPEGVHFKEKTARQSSDWRGFLTQKGAPSG